MLKIAAKIISFCLATTMLSFAFSQTRNSEGLVVDFNAMLSSSKELLNQLSLEVEAYEQWFKDYQSQVLLTNGGVLEDDLKQQLEEVWGEIEKLERQTKTGWLDSLSDQLGSLITAEVSNNEISSWISSQKLYVEKTQADVAVLGRDIEKIKQAYPISAPNSAIGFSLDSTAELKTEEITPDINIESLSSDTLEHIYIPEKTKEDDALEASLLFLLNGLEIWGQWLEPANEIGLLPEAEGRFMTSSTPILQAGSTTIPGGIGVVGFAQPIIISHDGIPEGFTEEISESLVIDYYDSIEDVFQKVPYHDRLVYQYGVQINGRSVQIYRRSIETELTLATVLQKMGAPPDTAELWVEEYAEIAFLPHTIQLSWLIAGNPLAKDYQLHTENLLTAFDLDLFVSKEEFISPQAPNSEWINEDPFWAELQNQPFLKAFANLLSGASKEIQRSFIVSLFFLEPNLPIVQGKVRSNTAGNVNVRSKPFFWEDSNPNNSPTAPPAIPVGSADPEQEPLVKRALHQRTNLIHYWTPRQGTTIIPWENRDSLNYDKGNPYFIMAVTALPQFEPTALENDTSNYPFIVREIVDNYLPNNQPVFKVFLGAEEKDRKLVTAQGTQLAFTDSNFIWSADGIDSSTIRQYAMSYYESNRRFPYVAVQLDSGPYLAGSLAQLKRLLQGKQNYSVQTIVLRSKGIGGYTRKFGKQETLFRSDENWLQYATRISADAFAWLPQRQDELFIQSTHRNALFKKKLDLTPEIKTTTMVKWPTLPSNEALLEERAQWRSDVFLIQVEEGYFLITVDEFAHLKNYADQTPEVHSLILSAETKLSHKLINTSARSILESKNIDCDSIRVLSAGGVDLAYSKQCSIIITESGKELAQAGTRALLSSAQEEDQPITLFRFLDRPASAVPLRALVDADPDDIEGLSVGTLVPVYDLEKLDEEETEAAIELSIADSIKRTLQFFPKQSTFEVLLPKNTLPGGQKFSYTSNAPTDFEATYSFDEIKVLTPSENKEITFYRAGGAVDIKLSADDVYIPSGEFNRGRLLELAQKFHEKNATPYTVIKSDKGNYYGGSLHSLNTGLPIQEYPENLLLMITRVKGVSNQGFGQRGSEYVGWLQLSAENVVEYAKELNTSPYDAINVLSASGQRHAAFSPFGEMLLAPTIQWTQRPSNKLLQSLRNTWEGNLVLVYVPDRGYFATHSSDGKFIESIPEAQIDTVVLASDSKNFSRVLTQAKNALSILKTTGSVRILSASATEEVPSTYSGLAPSVSVTEEAQPIYNGLDLALKIDNQGEPVVDLKRSGLELTENPEHWLRYAEAKNSPLSIFVWDDGKRSSTLLIHLQRAMQDLTSVRSQQIVPVYSIEDLEDAANSEQEDIIATSVQDALQRALNFLPHQAFFQVAMPDGKTSRYYSQTPPNKDQIQPEPLGIIEVTRQFDNTRVKYYYHPENSGVAAQSNTDATKTLALLARETGFENTQYQGTHPPTLEELAEKFQILLKEVPKELTRIYAVLKVGDQAYFGGPWHKIREITGLNNVTVDTVVVSNGVSFFLGKKTDGLPESRNWLSDWAGKTARDVFSTFPQNSSLTVCDRSCTRKVVFKRNERSEIIDLAAMPQTSLALQEAQEKTYIQWWDHLPSNAELLIERAKWQPNMVLMHAPTLDRYFFIARREVPYFEKYTDQPVQVHTLVWMSETTARFTDFKVRLQKALSELPEYVSKIRVISAPNHEISFDRECKIDVFGSCVELLQQKPSEMLATTSRWYDVLVVFQNSSQEGKVHFSGVPFHMLLDVDLEELHAEGITPHSLVPIYSDELLAEPDKALSNVDTREEVAFFVTEAIRKIHPIFPKSQAIKILMPDGTLTEYTLEGKVNIDESDPLSVISFTSSNGGTVKFYRV